MTEPSKETTTINKNMIEESTKLLNVEEILEEQIVRKKVPGMPLDYTKSNLDSLCNVALSMDKILSPVKTESSESLDEKSGLFYTCNCKDDEKKLDEELMESSSDTDSASENENNIKIRKQYYNYCHICGNGYSTRLKLALHLGQHKLRCHLCPKVCQTSKEYKSHMKGHIVKIFVCHICKKNFKHKSLLLSHLNNHMEKEVFETVVSMEEEFRRNKIRKIYCEICHTPFLTQSAKDEHFRRHFRCAVLPQYHFLY